MPLKLTEFNASSSEAGIPGMAFGIPGRMAGISKKCRELLLDVLVDLAGVNSRENPV